MLNRMVSLIAGAMATTPVEVRLFCRSCVFAHGKARRSSFSLIVLVNLKKGKKTLEWFS